MPIKHSKMRTSDKIEYWVDIADYDIKTARSMHEAGKYLYSVFMCQQGMEKVLKAIYLKKFSNEAPFSHNLIYLQGLLDLGLPAERLELLAELTAFYIEGRYPSYKEKLSKIVNKKKSLEIIEKSLGLYKWLKLRLKQ